MNKTFKRVLLRIAGVFFLLLGVLGLFLPVLQGFLFLFLGAALLTIGTPAFRWLRLDKLADKLESRYPGAAAKLREWGNVDE